MAKRAVLIGINKYQVPGSDLNGCVNDVKNLSGVLKTYYDFAAKDITTLTDLQATKKAMQAAIQKLIKSGKKGDTLLLHYSGHGSNVPDDNGDEADTETRSCARPIWIGRIRCATIGYGKPLISFERASALR